MKKQIRFFNTTLVVLTMLAMVFSAGPSAFSSPEARKEVKPHSEQAFQKMKETKTVNINNANLFISLEPGSVFKGRNNPALYYLDDDGSRRVFPNEATYMSWYDDFNNVIEVDDAQLAEYPLSGNVRYRPGSFLVKVQTDPKVYAVGENGLLRWIKTEQIARELYGGNWNKLIDDIPAAFFVNYRIGDLIDEISDFDPVLAQEIETITENLREKIQEKIQERLDNQRLRYCKRMDKYLAKLQKRLAKWDLSMETYDEGFMDRCMNQTPDDDDDDDVPQDATAPVISGITATPSTTSAIIAWTTDEQSDGVVEYSDESLATASTTISVNGSNDTTSHTITLDSLEPETTYYYMVKATDAAGNMATSTEMTFVTEAEIIPDTTAPVISGIESTPSSTTALISWITDEAANSRIEYATTSLTSASSTMELTDSAFVTNHLFELIDLATSTQYFFIVESADAATNLATSTEQTFTTL